MGNSVFQSLLKPFEYMSDFEAKTYQTLEANLLTPVLGAEIHGIFIDPCPGPEYF